MTLFFSMSTVLSTLFGMAVWKRQVSSYCHAFANVPASVGFKRAALVSRGGGSTSVFSTATEQEEGTTTTSAAYQELITKLETITQLSRASAVLSYDQQVFMPASASAERGAQMAALATVLHDKRTDPKLLELMDQAWKELVDKNTDDADALRLLELERKAFMENQCVPASLAAKAASLSASAYSEWIEAKEAKDFKMFSSTLQDCFDTAMAIAQAKLEYKQSADDGEKVDESFTLYDQMLDEYEVGMSQSRINEIFDQVQSALVPLIAKVLASPTPPSSQPLSGQTFPIDKQQELSETIVKAIGFDSTNGRIDVSVHPFTSSMSSKDVRIISRFRDDEWYQGLAGTIHEGGHAIYEQNIGKSSALSIDSALSMGTHESQSLFWERHVGLSKPFWKWATPLLKDTLLEEDKGEYSEQDVYGAVNAVSQSLIRVEADELTYPLHVILRYNIEKDVINGNLAVKDIPKRWNDDMKSMLNIDVPSDDKGCLQDVHWAALAFGYFPTYLIGAIAAAQLEHYCHLDIPDMDAQIENGEFGQIKDWLTSKVHRHGRRYESLDAMFSDQLGEPLNPKYFIEYMTNKYTDLYKL